MRLKASLFNIQFWHDKDKLFKIFINCIRLLIFSNPITTIVLSFIVMTVFLVTKRVIEIKNKIYPCRPVSFFSLVDVSI